MKRTCDKTSRSSIRWVLWLAAATLCGVGSAHAASVVTDHIISQANHGQSNVSVTFGQVFKDGDVPRDASVAATVGGHRVPLQIDVKATNPDGSLRHAVLTVRVPKLASNANEALAVVRAAPQPASAPVSLASLLATRYDAKASLAIGGTQYSVDARSLLQAAAKGGACKPWGIRCNVWLSGPLVGEWIVAGPVTAPDGTAEPNLRVYFHVRAYAGTTPGSIAYVRTNVVVENTLAYSPQAQPSYSATLTSGSAKFTSAALTQYAYTRWHRVLWWNGVAPQAYLQQDTNYIQASMAVSRYEALAPDEKFLASLRQWCAPLDHCDQTQRMGNAGAQAAIGPLPRWTSVYIVDPDARAYHWMLANTDALGAYSIHYRDQETGYALSIRKHPYVTIIDWAYANRASRKTGERAADYRRDLLPTCTNDAVVTDCAQPGYATGNPDVWDNAHQPAEAYVAYMVTGDYYYMSELAFGASHNNLWSNETYRGFAQGLIDRAHSQVRGKAWVLREMADAAYLLPDDHPLKREFKANVENSLAEWNHKYTYNPQANALRVMDEGPIYSVNGGKRNGVAPWQHAFFTWSTGHAAELGFKGAADFRDWLAAFELGLMTDWMDTPAFGYCWLLASNYNVQVKDSTGHWLPDFTTVYRTTFPSLAGLKCNSPKMVVELGKLKKQAWTAGQMDGYPYSPVGFPANLQVGLAAAVDSGLPTGAQAWQIFESRSIRPVPPHGYNDYPNFAVLPRHAADATDAVQ